MATENEKQPLDLYGVDPSHQQLKDGYETDAAYKKQGDTRTVKFLLLPVHVKTASPMFPGVEVFQERLLRRGDRVTVKELGLIALEKGERLGAFFTDSELAAGVPGLPAQPVKVSTADVEGTEPSLSELGAPELVEWIGSKSIPEIMDEVGDDKDLAKRMIEAENLRDKDDPRKSLLEKLTKVAEA